MRVFICLYASLFASLCLASLCQWSMFFIESVKNIFTSSDLLVEI